MMSSCRGQKIYPPLLATGTVNPEGTLSLKCIPGTLVRDGETYSQVLSWDVKDNIKHDKIGSHEPASRRQTYLTVSPHRIYMQITSSGRSKSRSQIFWWQPQLYSFATSRKEAPSQGLGRSRQAKMAKEANDTYLAG